MSPRIIRKVGPPPMKKNAAGESEGIAGQTRRIPGSAGHLNSSPSNPHACTPLRAKRQPAEWVSACVWILINNPRPPWRRP